MKKKKFYLFSVAREYYDHKGKSLGMGNDRKIYYVKSIGTHRIYRSDAENPTKGLVLLTFATEKEAQETADYTNKSFNDNFEVRELA